MTELKPCPFCGGEASIQNRNAILHVICGECVCSTGYYATDATGRKNAITAWNTRATPVVKQSLTADVTEADTQLAQRFMREYHMDLADTKDLAKDASAHRIAAFEAGRVAGLEEAAMVADGNNYGEVWADRIRQEIATAIRALKEKNDG